MTLTSPRAIPRFDALQESAREIDGMEPESIRLIVEILAFADTLERAYDANLASYDLSQGRLYALLNVANAGKDGISPADLADVLGVTRATVTGLVDGLERDKLIRRLQRSDDRRRWTLRITRDGIEKLQAIMPPHCQTIARAMRGLSTDEKNELIGLLAKLARTVPELSAKPA